MLLLLLEGVLEEVCANGTRGSSTEAAQEPAAGLVGGPTCSAATDKGSSKAALAVRTAGLARSGLLVLPGAALAILRLRLTVGAALVAAAVLLLVTGWLRRVAAAVVAISR